MIEEISTHPLDTVIIVLIGASVLYTLFCIVSWVARGISNMLEKDTSIVKRVLRFCCGLLDGHSDSNYIGIKVISGNPVAYTKCKRCGAFVQKGYKSGLLWGYFQSGSAVPPHLGLAWKRFAFDEALCILIPFNIVFRAFIGAYYIARYPFRFIEYIRKGVN
jgi:hypothetical protein